MRNPKLYAEKVILAPMVRIGTLPMRFMALNLGADLVFSPEIVDKSIIGAERRINPLTGTVDYVKGGKLIFRTHPAEREVLVFQLGTSDPHLALQAARTVQQDVAAFDLNCGCPKRFSLQAGMGAALLKRPELLCSILEALIAGTERPVSAKIRLFLDDLEGTHALVKRIIKTGVSALTIHTRDPQERSDRHPAHWNLFVELAETVKQANAEAGMDEPATLVLNGDIGLKGNCSYSPHLDLKTILAASGASSIMSARAVQWNPLCLRDLKAALLGSTSQSENMVSTDSLKEATKIYLQFAFSTLNPFNNTKYILLQFWNQVATKPDGGRELATAVQQAKSNSDFARLFGVPFEEHLADSTPPVHSLRVQSLRAQMPAKKVSAVKAAAAPTSAPAKKSAAAPVKKEKAASPSKRASVARSASPAPRQRGASKKVATEDAAEPEVSPKKTVKKAAASKAKKSTPEQVKEKPSSSSGKKHPLVKGYLMLYNAASAVAWAFLLFNLAKSYFVDEPQNYRILFPKTGQYLAYLQSAALLEIVHAAAGWVPSSVISNVIQIASRLFIIWVCAIHYGQGKHWGYALLSFAWSISDLTRYLYYLTQLTGVSVPLLKWARYNFFLVLYPVGTIGEVMLLFWARQRNFHVPQVYWPLLAVIAIYAPGFLYMYEHMLIQRSKQAKKDKQN